MGLCEKADPLVEQSDDPPGEKFWFDTNANRLIPVDREHTYETPEGIDFGSAIMDGWVRGTFTEYPDGKLELSLEGHTPKIMQNVALWFVQNRGELDEIYLDWFNNTGQQQYANLKMPLQVKKFLRSGRVE
jgi:hypothetical protein